jgi:hypothetical protein
MSRPIAAPHDAPRARIRRAHLIAVPTAALVALALAVPAVGQAHAGKATASGCGKSADHKPAGTGGGRRVR